MNDELKTNAFYSSPRIHHSSLLFQPVAEEVERALPGVRGGRRVVGRGARVVVEAVPGPLVDFEVDLLARLLQSPFDLPHGRGRDARVLRAEVAQKRGG